MPSLYYAYDYSYQPIIVISNNDLGNIKKTTANVHNVRMQFIFHVAFKASLVEPAVKKSEQNNIRYWKRTHVR